MGDAMYIGDLCGMTASFFLLKTILRRTQLRILGKLLYFFPCTISPTWPFIVEGRPKFEVVLQYIGLAKTVAIAAAVVTRNTRLERPGEAIVSGPPIIAAMPKVLRRNQRSNVVVSLFHLGVLREGWVCRTNAR
jgi:hypothetical protein